MGIGFSSLFHSRMDDLHFTSISTVFQSYQDDERLIMKGCKQWNPVHG